MVRVGNRSERMHCRLSVQLSGEAANVYTVFGEPDAEMSLPPAYQTDAPFGANTGGVDPGFFSVMPTSAFDSWLTVGLTEGDSAGALGSVGIDWETWTPDTGLTIDNGAVFWMDPNAGPGSDSGDIVLAQVTVPTGTEFTAVLNVQGRGTGARDVGEHGEPGEHSLSPAILTISSCGSSDSHVVWVFCCAGEVSDGWHSFGLQFTNADQTGDPACLSARPPARLPACLPACSVAPV